MEGFPVRFVRKSVGRQRHRDEAHRSRHGGRIYPELFEPRNAGSPTFRTTLVSNRLVTHAVEEVAEVSLLHTASAAFSYLGELFGFNSNHGYKKSEPN